MSRCVTRCHANIPLDGLASRKKKSERSLRSLVWEGKNRRTTQAKPSTRTASRPANRPCRNGNGPGLASRTRSRVEHARRMEVTVSGRYPAELCSNPQLEPRSRDPFRLRICAGQNREGRILPRTPSSPKGGPTLAKTPASPLSSGSNGPFALQV